MITRITIIYWISSLSNPLLGYPIPIGYPDPVPYLLIDMGFRAT